MLAAIIARWFVAVPLAASVSVTVMGSVLHPGHHRHVMGLVCIAFAVAVAAVRGAAVILSIVPRRGGPHAGRGFGRVAIAIGICCRLDGIRESMASPANVGGIVAMPRACSLPAEPLCRLTVAA